MQHTLSSQAWTHLLTLIVDHSSSAWHQAVLIYSRASYAPTTVGYGFMGSCGFMGSFVRDHQIKAVHLIGCTALVLCSTPCPASRTRARTMLHCLQKCVGICPMCTMLCHTSRLSALYTEFITSAEHLPSPLCSACVWLPEACATFGRWCA